VLFVELLVLEQSVRPRVHENFIVSAAADFMVMNCPPDYLHACCL